MAMKVGVGVRPAGYVANRKMGWTSSRVNSVHSTDCKSYIVCRFSGE